VYIYIYIYIYIYTQVRSYRILNIFLMPEICFLGGQRKYKPLGTRSGMLGYGGP